MNLPFSLRQPCPPGSCICNREVLLETAEADIRILKLTKEEEKRLLARLERLTSLEDLRAMQARMHTQLGIVLLIVPSSNEVRSVRGISIQVQALPGLCRKTSAAIPAAIRRGFERCPEIVYALLNEGDLLADA